MIDRKTLDRKIDECEEAIASERDLEEVILANLGQAVSAAGMASAGTLDAKAKTISDFSDDIRKLEDSLGCLLRDEQRRAAIKDEKKQLNAEIRDNIKKRTAVLEEIGRGAWAEWKSGSFVHGDLEKALKDTADAEMRLNDAEDAYSRNNAGARDRTPSIFARGKAFLLAARRKSARIAMKRQWEKAGVKVMETIPSRSFAKTPISTVISSLRSLDSLLVAAQKRIAELKKELKEMDAALEQMPGKGGVRKRIAWIEIALEDRRNDLDEAYIALGRSWGESNTETPQAGVVEDRRLEWIAQKSRVEKREVERAVISEYLEYLDFQELAEKTRTRIEILDEEISSRQAVMKKLKKELSLQEKDLEQRKRRLPKLPAEES